MKATAKEGWTAELVRARRSATSLVGLCAVEPQNAIAEAVRALGGEVPKVRWDCMSGWTAINETGEAALQAVIGGEDERQVEYPSEALKQARKMPAKSIVFMLNLHRFFQSNDAMAALVTQGLWNLREPYKADRRTLVMVSPSFQLPAELKQDVLVIREAYPTAEQHAVAIKALAESNGVTIARELVEQAAGQLVGLNAYAAEQATSEAMIGAVGVGLDLPYIVRRKRSMIDAVEGLSVYTGTETYADIGGNEAAKLALRRKIDGKRPFRVLVWCDEIEKAIAGSSGAAQDTSGASQAILAAMLTSMQNYKWTGHLLIGPGGGGKSLFAKATGNEAGVPCVMFDLGQLKGSFVGETEAKANTAFSVLEAIGGERVHFMATCNSIGVMPPELLRRFNDGIYMFDLPTVEEQAPIWALGFRQYGLPEQPLPPCCEWTGAEIMTCCRNAWEYGIPLAESAKLVVPLVMQAPERIRRLREECSGKYLSAQTPGAYSWSVKQEPAPKTGRKLAL